MTAAQLIDELRENAQVSGNQLLERRLADLAVWLHENKDRIPRDNLASRQAFLEKAFWIQLEIIALLLERIREKTGSKGLFLPSSLSIRP